MFTKLYNKKEIVDSQSKGFFMHIISFYHYIEYSRLPHWIKRAIDKYEIKHDPLDCVKYFNGKTFRYKVIYTCNGQGNIDRKIYRKYKNSIL